MLSQIMQHRADVAKEQNKSIVVYVDNGTPDDILYSCWEPGMRMVIQPVTAASSTPSTAARSCAFSAIVAPPSPLSDVIVNSFEQAIYAAKDNGLTGSQLLNMLVTRSGRCDTLSDLVASVNLLVGVLARLQSELRTVVTVPGYSEPVFVAKSFESQFLQESDRAEYLSGEFQVISVD